MLKPFKYTYLICIYILLYIPIAMIVAFSFNNASHSLIWHGFTVRWYAELFHDANLGIITLHSLLLSLAAATVATTLGMVAAVGLYRYRFFGKQIMQLSIFILIIIPDLVLAIALLLAFTITRFPLGFFSLLLAHITMTLPFCIMLISNRLNTLNRNLIEASQDLGANEQILYRHILIPLLWPALLAAWLLSFTLSLDDVIISYFVSGPNFEILPLKIYSMVKIGVKPEINALCSLILFFTIAAIITAQLFIRQRPCND